jgi:hypothetical protein
MHHLIVYATPAKYSAMYHGVECLDPTRHHLGGASVIGYFDYIEAFLS